MKQWVKLDREITEDDVGKRVKLRNGGIEMIQHVILGGIYPVKLRETSCTVTGSYYIRGTVEYDIVEIEEPLALFNEGETFNFTIPKETVKIELKINGYKVTVEKEN